MSQHVEEALHYMKEKFGFGRFLVGVISQATSYMKAHFFSSLFLLLSLAHLSSSHLVGSQNFASFSERVSQFFFKKYH